MDRDGNAVALTQTVNTLFGSGITVPGTGIVLNNEMDDFSAAPGKLVGSPGVTLPNRSLDRGDPALGITAECQQVAAS